MTWEAMGAISSAVATLVLVVSAPLALRQLAEAKRARQLDASFRLFDELSSREARLSRARLYDRFPLEKAPTAEDILVADEALSPFDRAWLLIEQGYVSADFVVDTFGDVILRVWSVTELFVAEERLRRTSSYRQRAETLVEVVKASFAETGRPTPGLYRIRPASANESLAPDEV